MEIYRLGSELQYNKPEDDIDFSGLTTMDTEGLISYSNLDAIETNQDRGVSAWMMDNEHPDELDVIYQSNFQLRSDRDAIYKN